MLLFELGQLARELALGACLCLETARELVDLLLKRVDLQVGRHLSLVRVALQARPLGVELVYLAACLGPLGHQLLVLLVAGQKRFGVLVDG